MFKLKDYFTAGSLLVSLGAVILAFQGRIPLASFLVFVAWGFDALDGLVARLTRTRNEFGAQFDDLVDHIAYTVAPGFIVYAALGPRAWWVGLAGCFAVILLGTVRLAVANTLSLRYPGFWIGVPRPASGFLIVFVLNARLFSGGRLIALQAALIVLLAAAGLTRLPYKNHKGRLEAWEKAFPVAAIASSVACFPIGWMWDVGLAWGTVYLLSPWLAVGRERRREIAAALRRSEAEGPAVQA